MIKFPILFSSNSSSVILETVLHFICKTNKSPIRAVWLCIHLCLSRWRPLKIVIIKNSKFLQLLECLKKQTQIFQKPPSTFSFFFIFQLSLPFSNVLVFSIFKNLLNFIFLGYLIAKLQRDSFTKAKEREKRKHTEKSKWRQNEKAAIAKKYHRIKSWGYKKNIKEKERKTRRQNGDN